MNKDIDLDSALDGLRGWVGRECTAVLRRDFDWSFSFEDAGGVTCWGPWRILSKDRICLTNVDDGQLFGLKQPVDGRARAKEILFGRKILSIKITPISSDLVVSFHGKVLLEVLSYSAGYEGWEATAKSGGRGSHIVATGGGALTIWTEERGRK